MHPPLPFPQVVLTGNGYDSIPAHFKEHLELLPVLVEVATDLYTGSARTDDVISWKRKYLEGHRAD